MKKLDRREALEVLFVGSSALLVGCATTRENSDPLVECSKHVKIHTNWASEDFDEFLEHVPQDSILSLQKSLALVDKDAKEPLHEDHDANIVAIEKQMVWLSTNVMAYPFVTKDEVDYHNVLCSVATDFGVDKSKVKRNTSFFVERNINEQAFAKVWDKLNEQQRKDLLLKIDHKQKLSDHAGIAALSGAAALAALGTTVYFTGFAFYMTMSVVISTVAAWVGVTLPIVVYTGASALIALLTGPIGLALIFVATALGVVFLGRRNSEKLVAAVLQIHAIKCASLKASGHRDSDVFTTL